MWRHIFAMKNSNRLKYLKLEERKWKTAKEIALQGLSSEGIKTFVSLYTLILKAIYRPFSPKEQFKNDEDENPRPEIGE